VWGFAPVQDRHAAPAIGRALQDLAACDEVEVIVVARGGGSLADLYAFCDETLCRTVALLRVPVISSVGHHTDRTLLDDVAAVSCSTPTHAAESAVPVDCSHARALLAGHAKRLDRHGRRAVLERARTLARLSRAPSHHVARHRTRLHQQLRELRAATRRALLEGEKVTLRRATVLARKSTAASFAAERATQRFRADATTLQRTATLERRRRDLERLTATLTAHDPQRTLERGYALIEGPDGEPITSATTAREQPELTLRFHDGRVTTRGESATRGAPAAHAASGEAEPRAAGEAAPCASGEAAPAAPAGEAAPRASGDAAQAAQAGEATPHETAAREAAPHETAAREAAPHETAGGEAAPAAPAADAAPRETAGGEADPGDEPAAARLRPATAAGRAAAADEPTLF